MKNLLRNKNGNANVIILAIVTIVMGFGMLTIGTYLYYQIATSADAGQVIALRGTQAAGSFAFNGSNFTSDGSVGMITNATITNGAAIYIFEFNTSSQANRQCAVANCILVNVSYTNTSLGGATNLTVAINANTSTAAIVTATRTANTTVVTYDTRSTAGNSIVLSDDAPQGQTNWIASTNLSGGSNDVTGQAAQTSINSYANIAFPLMGLAMMILGFGVIFYTLRGSFGTGQPR